MDQSEIESQLRIAKEREAELQQQVEELQDFIENAALPLHWVNGSGIVIWANKVELEFLGYTKEEYIGNHISNFHADKEVIEEILHRLINKETLKNFPARLRCKNGDIKPVLINSNVLWRNDKFIHTRCFTRDITDLKKLDEKKIELINTLHEKNVELIKENKNLKLRIESISK